MTLIRRRVLGNIIDERLEEIMSPVRNIIWFSVAVNILIPVVVLVVLGVVYWVKKKRT